MIIDQDGRRSLVTRTADGKSKTQKLSENFKSNPTTLAFHDANQDGLADLVVLIPYEKVKVLLQVEGKDFEEVDVAPPGGAIEQPWLSTADIDGVVLGCTELPLILKQVDCRLKLFDTLDLHAEAALEFTLHTRI